MSEVLNPTIYPGLFYEDADAAMLWMERTLGCDCREDHRDEEGNVVHAEMGLRSAVIMLSSAGVGREIALELTETDYGSRDFTVRDPEGTLWSFGTYRPA